MDVARIRLGAVLDRSDQQYEDAFREAGFGRVHDDAEVVASRIRVSNVRDALVAALDDWSGLIDRPRREEWVLGVARRADPDQSSWRGRARDPAVRANKVAIAELIKSAHISGQSVPLLLALDRRLDPASKERLPFLKRVHEVHPGDFWVNQTVGEVLLRENKTD